MIVIENFSKSFNELKKALRKIARIDYTFEGLDINITKELEIFEKKITANLKGIELMRYDLENNFISGDKIEVFIKEEGTSKIGYFCSYSGDTYNKENQYLELTDYTRKGQLFDKRDRIYIKEICTIKRLKYNYE